MVDLGRVRPRRPRRRSAPRSASRRDAPLIGWVGRLDRKKRVEDFLDAAALVHAAEPAARFLVIGGPDAFMPEYAAELRALRHRPRPRRRPPLPRRPRRTCRDLLAALDVFVWLSRGEGMPHVIAEAGAAGLAIVATPDNGALQQIDDGVSGLFVPHEDPAAAAAAILRLVREPVLRRRLGAGLRAHVAAQLRRRGRGPAMAGALRRGPRRAAAGPAADALPELPPRRLGMLDPPPAATAAAST